MHDQPKLVGYGNQLAWNCLLLACMKIEHFHHKNLVHSGTRNSIKIYWGLSKSICNPRYFIFDSSIALKLHKEKKQIQIIFHFRFFIMHLVLICCG